MRDFIFIIGASAVGKTTLARGLFERYRGVLAEMNLVPEFYVPEGVDPGVFEEEVCWECCVAQLKRFHELGLRNIISGDFDDLRTADIPEVFRGCDYITLKLICSDFDGHFARMDAREGGLKLPRGTLSRYAERIAARPPLINEYVIDTAGRSVAEVLACAVELIDGAETLRDYDYTRPPRELFCSWVKSNHLD